MLNACSSEGANPVSRLLGALAAILVMGLMTPGLAEAPKDNSSWASRHSPAPGPAQSIGTYANGCITGAHPMPISGPGFETIRTQRNRFWGHPELIDFVTGFAATVDAEGLGTLMIADLGQPRGGPISGHGSHELGLDADIWLRLRPNPGMSDNERAKPYAVSMLRGGGGFTIDQNNWDFRHTRLYELAATDPRVSRIFAHPAIKRQLCDTATGDRSWLNKVRPWYGHHSHMHVRIACPVGSPDCKNQSPPPAGEGCGAELDWWFTDEPYKGSGKKGPRKAPPPLPAGCEAVYLAR